MSDRRASSIIKTSHQAKVWLAHGDGCEGCKALGPGELETIVRDLAKIEPAPRSNGYWCFVCGQVREDHATGCAFARAAAWVAAHPVPGDPK